MRVKSNFWSQKKLQRLGSNKRKTNPIRELNSHQFCNLIFNQTETNNTAEKLVLLWNKSDRITRNKIRQNLVKHRKELMTNAIYNKWIELKNQQPNCTQKIDYQPDKLFQTKPTIEPLIHHMQHLDLIAKWREEEFGTAGNWPGYGFHELEIFSKAEKFYIGFLGNLPIAALQLIDSKNYYCLIFEKNYHHPKIEKQLAEAFDLIFPYSSRLSDTEFYQRCKLDLELHLPTDFSF